MLIDLLLFDGLVYDEDDPFHVYDPDTDRIS